MAVSHCNRSSHCKFASYVHRANQHLVMSLRSRFGMAARAGARALFCGSRASRSAASSHTAFACGPAPRLSTSFRLFSAASKPERDPRFAKIQDADVAFFRSVVGDSGVVTDAEDLIPFNKCWMVFSNPRLLFEPGCVAVPLFFRNPTFPFFKLSVLTYPVCCCRKSIKVPHRSR